MKLTMLLIVAFVCMLVSPGTASGEPSVTWEIALNGGVKTYTYTVFHDFQPPGTLTEFWIRMPFVEASSITSFTCSDPSFYTAMSILDQDKVWEVYIAGGDLNFGGTLQMWLTTPADVPTVYGYGFNVGPFGGEPITNWGYTIWLDGHGEGQFGTYSVPVPGPAPEPSSLAALGLAISGAGITLMRRRRK